MSATDQIIDVHWILYCAMLVMFMQTGFAMLECGTVRAKNTKNILFKNVLDACVGALIWWAFGHGLAYDKGNAFIGFVSKSAFSNGYGAIETQDGGLVWANWFFQYVFAATSATIVSGAVAERTTVSAYLVYTCLLTSLIYPIVVHWIWSSDGWLSAFNENAPFKVIDFAGSGVVHMTGGVAGLWGAYLVGPRSQRFDHNMSSNFEPHSSVLQVLGTLVLWFGWYGFNAGSTLGLSADRSASDAARSTVTTTLSAAVGGLFATIYCRITQKQWSPSQLCNGIIAGLVSVTASCSVIQPWVAFVIGLLGSSIYCVSSRTIVKCKVDDPLDAFAVHGMCGMWGVLAAGLFAHPNYAYNNSCGVVYGCHEGFVSALIAILSVFAWVSVTTFMLFSVLKKLQILRISMHEEIAGLDVSKHGGSAYKITST